MTRQEIVDANPGVEFGPERRHGKFYRSMKIIEGEKFGVFVWHKDHEFHVDYYPAGHRGALESAKALILGAITEQKAA
jgi:hypothetical protein